MIRTMAVVVFAVLLGVAFSQTDLVKEVAPGVFVRQAEPEKRIIANTGWVVFRDYVLVIDANFPWGAKAALPDIKRTAKKPIRFVFNTHYHGDHAWGSSVFVDEGATVLCSADCAAESVAKNTPSWKDDKGEGGFSLKPYRLEHPQVSFSERLVLDDGTRRVELIKLGPGHTKGDAVAYLPKERVLFTGDLCVTRAGNNVADRDADPDHWLKALDRMLAMDVGTLVPGHGPVTGRESIAPQRAYLAALIEGVRAGIGRGESADALAKRLDLTGHKPNGGDVARNEASIRALYARYKK